MNEPFRFYGIQTSLTRWREIVIEVTGKKCSDLVPAPARSIISHQFDVELNSEDQEKLMQFWRAETGIPDAVDAQGRPFLWNSCVAFERTKES